MIFLIVFVVGEIVVIGEDMSGFLGVLNGMKPLGEVVLCSIDSHLAVSHLFSLETPILVFIFTVSALSGLSI